MYTVKMEVVGNVAYRVYYRDGVESHREVMVEGDDPRGV